MNELTCGLQRIYAFLVDNFTHADFYVASKLLDEFCVVEFPAVELADDSQGELTSVGARGIAGELFIGDIWVVFEFSGRLNNINSWFTSTFSYFCGKPSAFGQGCEINVVHHNRITVV